MKQLTKIKSIRLTENILLNLAELKKYRIKESLFIRKAIEEKLTRDLPILKIKSEKLPF